MSEDGTVTGEADILDDGFGRDLGADLGVGLGSGDRGSRLWGRRRRTPAPEPAAAPPPPTPDDARPPPGAASSPVPSEPSGSFEPAAPPEPAAPSEPSEDALDLVALLTGGKAPGSPEALRLAALLLGSEPPDGTGRATPAPVAALDDGLGSIDLPWLDPMTMDEETAVVVEPSGLSLMPADEEPAAVGEPPPPPPTFFDDEPLGSLDLPWLEPELVGDEAPAPVETSPVGLASPIGSAGPMLMGQPAAFDAAPPPPTGPRLAGPDEIPPPPAAGTQGPGGDEAAGAVNVFDLFGWPPPPSGLDGDDLRSLNDTRPFPLPVGNHTAVYDLSALQLLDQPPAVTHVGRPTAPDGEDPAAAPERQRRRLRAPFETGDQVFRGGAWAGGLSVLVIMAVVGLFLTVQAFPALRDRGWRFLTTEEWQPDTGVFGIAAVLFYTIAIAAVALLVAVPLATGTALFITEMAPRRLRSWFVAMVDLMAAVPSIVYGLWGLFFLQGRVIGLSRWLSVWLGWIPFFKVDGLDPSDPTASQSVFTASTFVAGLVVALMVIPISCSIMREVFSQAPPGEREGAFALGATRWGMVRTVVLPFGRGGMIGAIMLGLGRALGETIAVYLLISPVFEINWHVLQTGSNSVAALIVLRQGDASGFGLSALMAAGLALFVMTLFVNFGASAIVARSRSGALSEA